VKADGSSYDQPQGARRYAAAFAALGIPVAELDESEAAARVGRRAIREQLVEALDDWAGWTRDPAEARRLFRVAEAADPEPEGPRARARRALRDGDPDGLRRAAAEAAAAESPPGLLLRRLAKALGGQRRWGEAVELLEPARRRRPGDFWLNHDLGRAYLRTKPPRPDEAVRYFSVAAALRPKSAGAWLNLGAALRALKRPAEAAEECRKALALKPDLAEAHVNLGVALRDLKRPAEAAEECRKALALKPDYAEAYCNLGWALRDLGRFAEALREFRRGHELGVQRPDWRYPSAEWVRQAETLAQLDAALPAVLQGAAQPAGPAEAAAMARLCQGFKGRYAAAARLYADAFAAAPRLAAAHRYNAACSAALAAAGRGEDTSALTEGERDGLRRQALAWLRADLEARAKALDAGDASAREAVRQALAHWKEDADLAGLHDADAVDKLPEDDREACRRLWAGVDALLEKAGGK
jgi:serine/threonine-protein kinase